MIYLISNHLVYKDEDAIPQRMRRDLNNVSVLLEIAQDVFDTVLKKRKTYIQEIEVTEEPLRFLSRPIDFDTLQAYTVWKYPKLPVSEQWLARPLLDLGRTRYLTLADVDAAVESSKPAVEQYRSQNPTWFQTGTDVITKSMGFVDRVFRERHPGGKKTLVAFRVLEHLVKKP